MTLENFKESLLQNSPPAHLSIYLQALWYDGKGDWESAHNIINDMQGQEAAWVHAYLHRKEGDIGNAGYWYRSASKKMPSTPIEDEWSTIVQSFLTTS